MKMMCIHALPCPVQCQGLIQYVNFKLRHRRIFLRRRDSNIETRCKFFWDGVENFRDEVKIILRQVIKQNVPQVERIETK
jgi:hypothetical protein